MARRLYRKSVTIRKHPNELGRDFTVDSKAKLFQTTRAHIDFAAIHEIRFQTGPLPQSAQRHLRLGLSGGPLPLDGCLSIRFPCFRLWLLQLSQR